MRDTLSTKNSTNGQNDRGNAWQNKKRFFLIIGVLSFLLWLLFLSTMCYLYGSIWKYTTRVNAFNILHIDYDHDAIGECLTQAYQQLRGHPFPTLLQVDSSKYPHPDDVVQAVKENKFWGAFIVHSNSSNRLAAALHGGRDAQTYFSNPALTYVWNEVRYPPISDEAIGTSLKTLVDATRLAYNSLFAPTALQALNNTDPDALQVLLNPISSSSINLMPTNQGTKLFYNTVGMVMPILQQFFFLLILNGVCNEMKIYEQLPMKISLLLRTVLSVTFTLGAALCTVGYIWAFREDWQVNGNQFVLSWMTYWLLMYIHLLVLDSCTAFLPPPALPFCVLTYIIINITGTISPFEVNPGFYRWAYALPGREAYDVLTDIWSGGYVPHLHIALPVLFSWLVGAGALAIFGHRFRYHRLVKEYEKERMAEKDQTPNEPVDLDLHRRLSDDMRSEV
ncbi:hypothetical protein EDD37DRAFT_293415 [Exophiala viscosa]|uniref:DUF3533 domain-containing protein n=1 Tax=Exophiala viscosa TaxID=2486360 RepID=A0AAN6E6W9_9EURO|nr:hypothetical protein EDD36DRAFT_46787 [Exophiala viscosa]KAI1628105.1 hypothetical protein EDD37DRAFT_293415 [Exophiala viscosa]